MLGRTQGFWLALGAPARKVAALTWCFLVVRFLSAWLFVTPWTVARRPPLGISQTRVLEWVAISFSRGSYWSRNWTPCLLHWQALAGGFFTTEPPGKPLMWCTHKPFVGETVLSLPRSWGPLIPRRLRATDLIWLVLTPSIQMRKTEA